jgi:hypothetical protein
MVVALLFNYLVALIGLLFVATGDVSGWTVLIVLVVMGIVERELLVVRSLSDGDDASDEPEHHVHPRGPHHQTH